MINNKIDLVSLIRTVGRNIETLRNIKKMSLELLANELNLTVQELDDIEQAKVRDLPLGLVTEIANYFHCTLQQILDLQLIQVLNNSQNIVGGDRQVTYTNEVKDGYEIYINHLKEENLELKEKIKSLSK